MTDDSVTIPRETAKRIARVLRNLTEAAETGIARTSDGAPVQVFGLLEYADLLDPKPRNLRDEVARAWCAEYYGDSVSASKPAPDQLDAADVVLTVVADWLAAQPLRTPLSAIDLRHAERNQRDHDVRLLRGES